MLKNINDYYQLINDVKFFKIKNVEGALNEVFNFLLNTNFCEFYFNKKNKMIEYNLLNESILKSNSIIKFNEASNTSNSKIEQFLTNKRNEMELVNLFIENINCYSPVFNDKLYYREVYFLYRFKGWSYTRISKFSNIDLNQKKYNLILKEMDERMYEGFFSII